MRVRLICGVLGAGLIATAAAAQPSGPPPGAAGRALLTSMPPIANSYLPKDALDLMRVLPPPPAEKGPRQSADQQLYRDTRAMEGSARWKLAVGDVGMATPTLLSDFDCAVGATLSPQAAPALASLLGRSSADSFNAVEPPKRQFDRKRPPLYEPGVTCEPVASLSRSADYPSGHAVIGWTAALLLAEIFPDRATEVLVRGRAYGESRVVCGAHSASAVDASMMSAAAVVARLHASAEFQADLAAARAEAASLKRQGSSAACDAEAAVMAEALPR